MDGQFYPVGVDFLEDIKSEYFEVFVIGGLEEGDDVAHEVLLDEEFLHDFIPIYENEDEDKGPLPPVLAETLQVGGDCHLHIALH